MRQHTILRLFVVCSLVVLSLSSKVYAQFSKEELRRISRLRPQMPFDRSGDYRLIDAWRLKAERDTTTAAPSPWWHELILGKSLDLGRGWAMSFDGLIDVYTTSNPYDGAWLGYEIFATKELRAGHRLVLRSQHSYTTQSQRYMSGQKLLYFYAPERSGLFVVDLGRTSGNTTHIANEEAFSENFLTNLGTNKHYRDYTKYYASLRNSLHLSPALRADLLTLYEHRQPQVGYIGDRHQIWLSEVRLSYDFSSTPPQEADMPSAYRLPKGRFAPELSLSYRLALDPTNGRSSTPWHTYQAWGASLRSAYAFDDYKRIDYSIVAEGFLGNKEVDAYDALTLPIVSGIDRNPIDHVWATGQHLALRHGAWLWAKVNYGGGRMALAHIPLLKRLQLDERLHLRSLYHEGAIAWSEFGYSIGLGRMLRLGLSYGTNWQSKRRLAFSLSLPILFLTSRSSTRY